MRKLLKKAAECSGLFWPCKSKKPAPVNVETGVRRHNTTCLGMLRSVLQLLVAKLRLFANPDVVPIVLIKIAEVLA